MEGLLFYEPATLLTVVTYALTLVFVLYYEWARDKRIRKHEDVIHVLIDEAEVTAFTKAA